MWRPLSVTSNLVYDLFFLLFPVITKNTNKMFSFREPEISVKSVVPVFLLWRP
jgi:hypothetical protein